MISNTFREINHHDHLFRVKHASFNTTFVLHNGMENHTVVPKHLQMAADTLKNNISSISRECHFILSLLRKFFNKILWYG